MDPLVWMYFATMSELPAKEQSAALLASEAAKPAQLRRRTWHYVLLVALLILPLPAVMFARARLFPPPSTASRGTTPAVLAGE